MTHFGKALGGLMLLNKINGADVARKTGLNPGYISRLKNGSRIGCTPKVLKKLVRVVAKSNTEKAQLIAAHMKDESCGFYPRYIDVKIKAASKAATAGKS